MLVVPALVTVLATPTGVTAQSDKTFDDLLDAEMPALLEAYGVSGSVISYIDGGAVAWTRAYGVADVSDGTPMSPDMVFEFGSCGKVLTAWATMRLVEKGMVALDAPVNDYLERWQIESDDYDAEAVTVRRLLTHTSGLNMHGYSDFSPRRVDPPGLVETLEGMNLAEGLSEMLDTGEPSLGNAKLVQEPGSGYLYSGAGYGVLQMLIEDVTGRPFDAFVRTEITDPLGATTLRWAWTPELEMRAPTPYGEEGQRLEYRQLSVHGIGSEIATVPDFARFVAAAVAGPDGDPPGRGVLAQETIQLMTASWPEAASPDLEQGLGYAMGRLNGYRTVWHGGSNTGWMAYFILDTVSGDGFVVASPSNRAAPLHSTIIDLWVLATYGPFARTQWPPEPSIGLVSRPFLVVAMVLALVLAVGVFRFAREVGTGRRRLVRRPDRHALLRALPWSAAMLFGWYTVYSPLPLYLPRWFGDVWPTIGTRVLMVTLTAGMAFGVTRAFFPRYPPAAVDRRLNPEQTRGGTACLPVQDNVLPVPAMRCNSVTRAWWRGWSGPPGEPDNLPRHVRAAPGRRLAARQSTGRRAGTHGAAPFPCWSGSPAEGGDGRRE